MNLLLSSGTVLTSALLNNECQLKTLYTLGRDDGRGKMRLRTSSPLLWFQPVQPDLHVQPLRLKKA